MGYIKKMSNLQAFKTNNADTEQPTNNHSWYLQSDNQDLFGIWNLVFGFISPDLFLLITHYSNIPSFQSLTSMCADRG